ncbi:MAG: hypothetical protein ACK6A9_02440 [Dolichospermum sp.]|nr:hypothetical protein [Dolichospermum circinale Clear-D4]
MFIWIFLLMLGLGSFILFKKK